MAINNTEKTFSNMEFPLAMKRQDAFALDPTSVWDSLAKAKDYAKTNPTAYVGQVLSVVVEGVSTTYQIKNAAGDLDPLGTGDMDEDLDAYFEANTATDEEVQEMLNEVFGTNDAEG